jgi:hypothetical protein
VRRSSHGSTSNADREPPLHSSSACAQPHVRVPAREGPWADTVRARRLRNIVTCQHGAHVTNLAEAHADELAERIAFKVLEHLRAPASEPVAASMRSCSTTPTHPAMGASRPNLLLFSRVASWKRVPVGGHLPLAACVGLPAKLRAPMLSASARARTGDVSWRRSKARPFMGALACQENYDYVRLSAKDEATVVRRSGSELDLPGRCQRALDTETAWPVSSNPGCVIGLKLVVT